MRIGIAFDLVPVDRNGDGPDDRYEEFDKPETIEAIAAVLRDEGHEVVLLGDGRDFLRRVLDDPPDFVWNFAEGEGVGRSREARVPAVLEMLGIPYTGSDPLTLAAALDKDVARRLVAQAVASDKDVARPLSRIQAVAVPKGFVYEPCLPPEEFSCLLGREFAEPDDFPLILKPNLEGSSKGIRGRCLVDDAAEAIEEYRRLSRDYEQPILIEQFIAGDEVTVGMVCGHDGPVSGEFVGIMRIVPRTPDQRFVYSLEVKRNYRQLVDYEAPARMPFKVLGAVSGAAWTVYRALGCRDLARIDFRVKDGVPYFIEANPLPGLAPVTSDLVIMAQSYGIGHAELIRRILDVSLARNGLAPPRLVPS